MATFGTGPGVQRVLALAPHTDDVEIGCGASLARLVREGRSEVRVVAFSTADKSVPASLPPDINRVDCYTALKHLGIDEPDITVLDFPVREFSSHRQSILDQMIGLRDSYRPDVVFGPCSTDRHQDHFVVHQEMMRAFGDRTVLGAEFPWNCLSFTATAHIEVTEEDLAAKSSALGAYRSQTGRPYMTSDFVRSWAVTRGAQIKAPFAEAFEVLHWRMAS